MNLLDIANLRDRLKEDIAVIERFMDIVRREQGMRPLHDPQLPPTIEEQLRVAMEPPPKAPCTPEADRLLMSAYRALQQRGPAPPELAPHHGALMGIIHDYFLMHPLVPDPAVAGQQEVERNCDYCEALVPASHLQRCDQLGGIDVCPECLRKASEKQPCKSC